MHAAMLTTLSLVDMGRRGAYLIHQCWPLEVPADGGEPLKVSRWVDALKRRQRRFPAPRRQRAVREMPRARPSRACCGALEGAADRRDACRALRVAVLRPAVAHLSSRQ